MTRTAVRCHTVHSEVHDTADLYMKMKALTKMMQTETELSCLAVKQV